MAVNGWPSENRCARYRADRLEARGEARADLRRKIASIAQNSFSFGFKILEVRYALDRCNRDITCLLQCGAHLIVEGADNRRPNAIVFAEVRHQNIRRPGFPISAVVADTFEDANLFRVVQQLDERKMAVRKMIEAVSVGVLRFAPTTRRRPSYRVDHNHLRRLGDRRRVRLDLTVTLCCRSDIP
jgi:hypothetical protein